MYLNATRIGLQEEMRRFDGMRCNPVATTEKIEHPSAGNGDAISIYDEGGKKDSR